MKFESCFGACGGCPADRVPFRVENQEKLRLGNQTLGEPQAGRKKMAPGRHVYLRLGV